MAADPRQVVVIGSGMGGLTSALLLQSHGYQVTVLERHYRAGGFLHRFFRSGTGYDTGFHYVGGARKDQLLGKCLTHLGVYDQLSWTELDREGFDELWFPDMKIKIPAGYPAWIARLTEHFPHEAQGIQSFAALLQQATRAYGWFHLDPSVPPESVLPFEERTLQDALDEHFTDPRLKALLAAQTGPLYGVPPHEAPLGLHAIVTDHFLQGAWTIQGGGDRLAMTMVRKLRALGGNICLKTPATRIEMSGSDAVAVWSGTKRFDAALVVTDIHPLRVLELLPEGAVRPAYVSRVKASKPGLAHLGIYMRVKGDLSALARNNLYRFRSWNIRDLGRAVSPDDMSMYFLTCPGQRESGRPGSEQVVVAILLANYEVFAPLVGQPRSPAYKKVKQELLDGFLKVLKEDFPDWEVEWAEASTPLTTIDYTNSPEGAIYGHYHSVEQLGRYRFPMRIRARGVVQVGQTVGFPGICGAMMSAYVACADVIGTQTLINELHRT